MCCRKARGEAARKPVWRPSQFLLLGLRDHAEPLLTLFSPLSAPVFASYLTDIILSCWSSDKGLSVHIWHHCFPFLIWKKIFFIMKAIHFIKEELLNNLIPILTRKSFVNALISKHSWWPMSMHKIKVSLLPVKRWHFSASRIPSVIIQLGYALWELSTSVVHNIFGKFPYKDRNTFLPVSFSCCLGCFIMAEVLEAILGQLMMVLRMLARC